MASRTCTGNREKESKLKEVGVGLSEREKRDEGVGNRLYMRLMRAMRMLQTGLERGREGKRGEA